MCGPNKKSITRASGTPYQIFRPGICSNPNRVTSACKRTLCSSIHDFFPFGVLHATQSFTHSRHTQAQNILDHQIAVWDSLAREFD